MAKIEDIEGIAGAYGDKLRAAGIKSVERLLAVCKDPSGRTAIAEATGISQKLLLTWTNHADLFRVRGIASQYSELLEATGVDTVVELATRNAGNLTEAMGSVNATKRLVRALPSQDMVADWIAQAKKLPRVVTH